MENFGIYRDLYESTVEQKHLGMTRGTGAWARYNGDLPVGVLGPNGFLPCVNTRGNAYAYRNAKRYRPTKRELLSKLQ